MARDYKEEYRRYHSKPEQRRRRSARNKARRLMIKKRGKSAVKGRDVDHRDRNPENNSPSNLRIQKPSENRGRNK